jgi:asparagine N-glycosylation enzyme membrane subunit Stt3
VFLIFSAAYYVPFYLKNGLPSINGLYEEYRERRMSLESPMIENFLWEQGGYFTIFVLALAIFGLFKSQNKFIRYWSVFLLVLSFAAERFLIYLPFAAALLAVIGLEHSRKITNEILIIGMLAAAIFLSAELMAAVLILSILIYWIKKPEAPKLLLISFLLYITLAGGIKVYAMAYEPPQKEQYDAFLWMKYNIPENETVLADWQFGHWISGIGERKNYMDGYAEYAPEADKRLQNLKTFLKNCSIPSGIKYVYSEKWLIDLTNNDCIYEFDVIYNSSKLYEKPKYSEIYIFKVKG